MQKTQSSLRNCSVLDYYCKATGDTQKAGKHRPRGHSTSSGSMLTT